VSEVDVTLAWIEIDGLIASKGTVKEESRRFYNTELLC
jgi:hypothetical protein